MPLKRLWIHLALATATLTAVACGLLEEATPTAAIEAVPVEVGTPATAETVTSSANPLQEEAVEDQATATDPATAARLTVYAISEDESQARFELDEELRGRPTTVVGATNQMAGEIALNPADLSATQVGEIRIDASTLQTANSFRNRAIRNFILQTGQHQFITFVPTDIGDLPAEIVPGQPVDFTVSGDLTIRSITQSVSFSVTATADPGRSIRGTATTTIDRTSFDLRIPDVPNVANVEEQVELTIDFTAYATF